MTDSIILTDAARRILDAYCSLEDTALCRPSRADKRLAYDLAEKGTSFEFIAAAFCLAQIRRLSQPPPPQPIRSLAYFLPVIQELIDDSPDPAYLLYLINRRDRLKNRGST